MSETADDDEDLQHPRFIRMRAEDTFDGQERVFTQAAYDLQVHAPFTGRPGVCRAARSRTFIPGPGPAGRIYSPRPGDGYIPG
jgi:hypothetical protein